MQRAAQADRFTDRRCDASVCSAVEEDVDEGRDDLAGERFLIGDDIGAPQRASAGDDKKHKLLLLGSKGLPSQRRRLYRCFDRGPNIAAGEQDATGRVG